MNHAEIRMQAHMPLSFEFHSPETYKPGDVLLKAEQIQRCVDNVADTIAERFAGMQLRMVPILNGAVPFSYDLNRAIWRRGHTGVITEYIRAGSYGGTTVSSGELTILQDMDTLDLSGQHILLVDDIIDTGLTFSKLVDLLRSRNARSVTTCALLDKPSGRAPELASYRADITGVEIPPIWVFGYGLDNTGGKGRGCPDIMVGGPDLVL